MSDEWNEALQILKDDHVKMAAKHVIPLCLQSASLGAELAAIATLGLSCSIAFVVLLGIQPHLVRVSFLQSMSTPSLDAIA